MPPIFFAYLLIRGLCSLGTMQQLSNKYFILVIGDINY